MNRLDRPVRPEDRDRVVERDQADRPARQRAAQRRAKRGRHSGHCRARPRGRRPRGRRRGSGRTRAPRARAPDARGRSGASRAQRRASNRPRTGSDRRSRGTSRSPEQGTPERAEQQPEPADRRRRLDGSGDGDAGCPSTSLRAMQSANCAVSRDATSATTPRPYWATAPRSASSVTMSTRVPPFAAASVDSIVASAFPRPFASRALTASTTRPPASSSLLARDVGQELERDRPQLDVQLRLPGVLVHDLDQLGARHARDDARHVVQQAPGLLDGSRNLEAVLEPHQEVTIVAGGARLSRWHGIAGSWWSL